MKIRMLNRIKKQMVAISADKEKELIKLKDKAIRVFSMEMKTKRAIIAKMVESLGNSRELTTVPYDDSFHAWIRVDLSLLIDTKDKLERELLKEYFDLEFIGIDFENDCITTSEGPCIVINHEGDVLDQDSNKWFISKRDYETVESRNKLIEAYMEKSGYFPSIVKCDYYGNPSYANPSYASV